MEETKAVAIIAGYAALVILIAMAFLVYGFLQCCQLRQKKRFYQGVFETGRNSEDQNRQNEIVVGDIASDDSTVSVPSSL